MTTDTLLKSPAEGVPPPDQNGPKAHRPLYIIAADIRANWPKPHFAAFPYIYAMRSLNQIGEMYGLDSGVSVVAYFLANAATWRGEHARRIKQELRDILKTQNYTW